MTPEEKEKFRKLVKERMEKQYADNGISGIVEEMKKLMDEVDTGKI